MVLALSGLSAGCSHRLHLYSVDQPRVDQELPPGSDTEHRKKTRKHLVLEVINERDVAAKKTKEVNVSSQTYEEPETAAVKEEPTQENPEPMNFAKTAPHPTAEPESALQLPTQYKVEKDDTLQSISKKFYHSYSKWTKIYEANKAKIADPNRIKPGIVITIPAIYSPSQK